MQSELNWSAEPGHVLVLRTCDQNMKSNFGQFLWPREGYVEATDWDETKRCGHGLHGLLWAEGNIDLLYSRFNNIHSIPVWIVADVIDEDIIDLDDKVKFPKANVIYAGDRQTALALIYKYAPENVKKNMSLIYDNNRAEVGNKGFAVSNFNGISIGGNQSVAISGLYGYSCTNVSGYSRSSTNGTSIAGLSGIAESGAHGKSVSGLLGISISSEFGRSVTDAHGIAIVDHNGWAGSYGYPATLIFKHTESDNVNAEVLFVTKDGPIFPGKYYDINGNAVSEITL